MDLYATMRYKGLESDTQILRLGINNLFYMNSNVISILWFRLFIHIFIETID